MYYNTRRKNHIQQVYQQLTLMLQEIHIVHYVVALRFITRWH